MASARVRLLFLNTFLLRVRLFAGLPGPDHAFTAPAVPERALEIGQRLAGEYDVVALAEVFDRPEREAVLAGWKDRAASWVEGPGRTLWPPALATSGLLTITDGPPITRAERHTFAARGHHLRETDAWANKGVLYAEIDVGLPDSRLEVVSTHLIAGADLLTPHTRAHQAVAAERHRQVDELLAFVDRVHRPGNATVVVGDFNVEGIDPEAHHARRLRDSMAAAGFSDLWLEHGAGLGPTCNLLRLGDRIGAEGPDGLCPDDAHPPADAERIDYAFLRPGNVVTGVIRLARRSLPRESHAPGHGALAFLSDHLGLHLELELDGGPGGLSATRGGPRRSRRRTR